MEEVFDKRVQRSKTDIKRTFLNLLQEKPYHLISISEIVRKANYNRGTFYANFECKDYLLQEVIQEVLSEMIKQIRVPYKEITKVNFHNMDPRDITLFDYFKKNIDLFKLLLSNHIQVDFRFQMAKAIEELFIAEYEYELAEDSELDQKWLYIYRAHGVAGLIIRWIEEDCSTPPEYMSKQIIELMMTSTEVFYVKP
ncbi:TetR/AcrR family transcriptional regulator [Ornithinibacillus scapharcae]|uniref:TetR/AcrR family transcriptional regulator n=1 Tax=Ornithinibacillus scapharcae TaxID=1147159 RepID=UPI000225B82E|nr:TetR-like C-terminal domain-containing protein [Ornithinibacillus scapharcae]